MKLVVAVANDAVTANDDESAFDAYELETAFKTYDAVTAYDALVADKALPLKLPVNEVAVTFVLTCNPESGDIDAETLPDEI